MIQSMDRKESELCVTDIDKNRGHNHSGGAKILSETRETQLMIR